jgi:hypothetical protein
VSDGAYVKVGANGVSIVHEEHRPVHQRWRKARSGDVNARKTSGEEWLDALKPGRGEILAFLHFSSDHSDVHSSVQAGIHAVRLRGHLKQCSEEDVKSLNLPPSWQSNEVAGGVNLRVVSSGRRYISVGAGVLFVLAAAKTIVQWSGGAVTPWLVLTILLSATALWCALGDEVWHLERNCLVHRIGIGRWGHSRRYENADLDITERFSSKFGVPYYCLYAVVDGQSYFLMERGERELLQLAKFISFRTGWQIRSTHNEPPAVEA